jgi:hypothetical protein
LKYGHPVGERGPSLDVLLDHDHGDALVVDIGERLWGAIYAAEPRYEVPRACTVWVCLYWLEAG